MSEDGEMKTGFTLDALCKICILVLLGIELTNGEVVALL